MFSERTDDILKELLAELLILLESELVHFFLRLRNELLLKLRGHLLTLGLQLSEVSQVLFSDLLVDLQVLHVVFFEELLFKLGLDLGEETGLDATENDIVHCFGIFFNVLLKFLLELNDSILVDKHELLRECFLKNLPQSN